MVFDLGLPPSFTGNQGPLNTSLPQWDTLRITDYLGVDAWAAVMIDYLQLPYMQIHTDKLLGPGKATKDYGARMTQAPIEPAIDATRRHRYNMILRFGWGVDAFGHPVSRCRVLSGTVTSPQGICTRWRMQEVIGRNHGRTSQTDRRYCHCGTSP